MSWTEERVEKLTKLWSSGATASEIAKELGGVTRNAVIGKAHRLGLKSRPSPVKAQGAEDAAPKRPRKAAKTEKVAAPPPPEPKQPEQKPRAEAAPVAPPVKAAPVKQAPVRTPTPPVAAKAAPRSVDESPSAPPQIISVGPGGFLRQSPGDQQPPPPAPPRRLVPAKPSPEVADKTSLLDLSDRICRWPIGHPGEPDFYFCGQKVNPGYPYCVEHCGHAYQAQLPRGTRRPPPPIAYGNKPRG